MNPLHRSRVQRAVDQITGVSPAADHTLATSGLPQIPSGVVDQSLWRPSDVQVLVLHARSHVAGLEQQLTRLQAVLVEAGLCAACAAGGSAYCWCEEDPAA